MLFFLCSMDQRRAAVSSSLPLAFIGPFPGTHSIRCFLSARRGPVPSPPPPSSHSEDRYSIHLCLTKWFWKMYYHQFHVIPLSILILFWWPCLVYVALNTYASLCCSSSECQGVAALSQQPAEAPPTVERGPPPRPPPSSDELPPEKEKGDAERERPDSETESDADDM